MFFKKKFDIRFDFSDCWCIEPSRVEPEKDYSDFRQFEQFLDAHDLDVPDFDVPVFLNALQQILPPDAIVFLEGAPSASQAAKTLDAMEIETSVRVENARSWPRPRYCHVPFTMTNAEILASLFEHNESADICFHFNIYNEKEMLLSWHDAFDDSFYMAGVFDEQVIAGVCNEIGRNYVKISG